MNILLFNDNPVVKKLVALSAQKTKDTLDSVSSLDEVEGSDYDLLILDDALYSDDLFEMLKMGVTPKSTLLMATRSQAVPTGFDYVINKPFLPTDLVELLAKIEKRIAAMNTISSITDSPKEAEIASFDEDQNDVNMDDFDLESFDLSDLDDEIDLRDEINLDNLSFDDSVSSTAVLDHDEVQEVQNLLEDTEEEEWNIPQEAIIIKPLEGDFDPLSDGFATDKTDALDENDFFEDLALNEVDDSSFTDDLEPKDSFLLDDSLIDESGLDLNFEEPTDGDARMDDDALDHLGLEIEDAVNHLKPEAFDTELELGDIDFEALDREENMDFSGLEGFDPLDMLDERELKKAIGESIDELEESEPLDEVVLEDIPEEKTALSKASSTITTNSEGIEALQALLKTLSNEEVVKALKGLNITININFGNGA